MKSLPHEMRLLIEKYYADLCNMGYGEAPEVDQYNMAWNLANT